MDFKIDDKQKKKKIEMKMLFMQLYYIIKFIF